MFCACAQICKGEMWLGGLCWWPVGGVELAGSVGCALQGRWPAWCCRPAVGGLLLPRCCCTREGGGDPGGVCGSKGVCRDGRRGEGGSSQESSANGDGKSSQPGAAGCCQVLAVAAFAAAVAKGEERGSGLLVEEGSNPVLPGGTTASIGATSSTQVRAPTLHLATSLMTRPPGLRFRQQRLGGGGLGGQIMERGSRWICGGCE